MVNGYEAMIALTMITLFILMNINRNDIRDPVTNTINFNPSMDK